jgi:hypothetical protein
VSTLNTPSEQPIDPRGDDPLAGSLSLPPVPGSERSKAVLPESLDVMNRRASARPRHQFIVNVHIKDDTTIFIPKPDPKDPTTKVEQTIWNHIANLPAGTSHRIDFDQQTLRIKVRGTGPAADDLRQRVSEVSVTGLRMKLVDSSLILYQATTTDGQLMHLTPVDSDNEIRQITKREQLFADRNKAKARRLLELKFTLLGALTREEYDQALLQRTYSNSASTKLAEYNDSLAQLLAPHLQSKAGAQPALWAQEMKRAIDFVRTSLKSPYPHIDALLSIIDPQSKVYRAVASNRSFQDFIKDCGNYGVFPSFSAQGQAKLALQPIIRKIIAALPSELTK